MSSADAGQVRMNISVNGIEYQDEHDAKKAIRRARRDEAKAEKIRQVKRSRAEANAAKALLEAVKGHERRTGHYQMHPAIEQAEAAIAKAEGRTEP